MAQAQRMARAGPAHQLLAAPADGEGRTALIEAKEILEDLLRNGPMPPTEIRQAAAGAGVKVE